MVSRCRPLLICRASLAHSWVMHDAPARPLAQAPRRRPWLFWAVATVPALLSTFETVVFMRMANRPIAVWRAFVAEAPQWYGWALLAPVIITLGRRFPIKRPLRAGNFVVHALASLSCGLLVAIGTAAVNMFVRPSQGPPLAAARPDVSRSGEVRLSPSAPCFPVCREAPRGTTHILPACPP